MNSETMRRAIERTAPGALDDLGKHLGGPSGKDDHPNGTPQTVHVKGRGKNDAALAVAAVVGVGLVIGGRSAIFKPSNLRRVSAAEEGAEAAFFGDLAEQLTKYTRRSGLDGQSTNFKALAEHYGVKHTDPGIVKDVTEGIRRWLGDTYYSKKIRDYSKSASAPFDAEYESFLRLYNSAPVANRTIYRGINRDAGSGYVDEIISKARPGAKIDIDLGSFSKRRETAERFARWESRDWPQREDPGVVFRVTGRVKGLDPSAFSKQLNEDEIVAGGRFVVGRVTKVGRNTMVDLTQDEAFRYTPKSAPVEYTDALNRMLSGHRVGKRVEDAVGDPDYAAAMDDLVISGAISKIDDDQRQVFGWASITEMDGKPVVDLQDDVIETAELEKAAYDYVLHSRVGGEMHQRVGKSSPKQIGTLIESMVLTPEKIAKMGLPAETPSGWWIGFQVDKGEAGDEVWKAVKSGKYTGFSIHGAGVRKRTPLEEIGKAVSSRTPEEIAGWLTRMAGEIGIEPQELAKALDGEFGDDSPSDDEIHEFLVSTYGDGNVGVAKHLIGNHEQKDHDPKRKGERKGGHSRKEHSRTQRRQDQSAAEVAGYGAAGTYAAVGGLSRVDAADNLRHVRNMRDIPMPGQAPMQLERVRSLPFGKPKYLSDTARAARGLRFAGAPWLGAAALAGGGTALAANAASNKLDRKKKVRKDFLLAKAAQRSSSVQEFAKNLGHIAEALGEDPDAQFFSDVAKTMGTGRVSIPEPDRDEVLTKRQQQILSKYLGAISKRIEQRGDKWVVLSESGSVLGTHDSEGKAKRQLAAVEANKDS